MNKSPHPEHSNPLRDVPKYVRMFRVHLGPRIYFVVVLSLFAALAEGVGIIMVLPLLQHLLTSEPPLPGQSSDLAQALSSLQLSPAILLTSIALAFLAKGVLLFLSLAVIAKLRADLGRQLKTKLFDAYSSMNYLYYTSRDLGHFINLIYGQTNQMLAAFQSLNNVSAQALTALTFITLALLVAWEFGVIFIIAGVAILMTFRRLNISVRQVSRLASAENSRLAKLLVQYLHGFKFLTATNQTPSVRGQVFESVDRLTEYERRKGIAEAFTGAIKEPISLVIILSVVVVQVVILDQPLGPILVAILLLHRGTQSLLSMQASWQVTLSQIGSLELVDAEFAAQVLHRAPNGLAGLPPLANDIVFRDVYFQYSEGVRYVLSGVSLTIPARSSVALVGESGAGKTTVADMISLLLAPTHGEILVDGTPVSSIEKASWRRQLGYVSQDAVIFDDTVANNISMWSGHAGGDEIAEQIRAAAQQANIAEFIDELPDGYETLVGDRGVRLSGGQRQRLFIARELFRQPRVLILDEATSALDSESERYVQQSIDALQGQVTVIMIAHRLSTIRNVDYVFVFDRGQVVESGSYEDLRSRPDSKLSRAIAMQSI